MSKSSLPVQPVTVHPDIISMSGMCAKEASTCLTIALKWRKGAAALKLKSHLLSKFETMNIQTVDNSFILHLLI